MELELKLERVQREIEGKLVDARDKAVEDFKKSEVFNDLKGKYAMG